MRDLSVATQDAMDPSEILQTLSKLEEQICCAETIKIPEDKLIESKKVMETLQNKVTLVSYVFNFL